MPATLVAAGVHDVRVRRVHVDFVDACVFTDVQNLVPGLATIQRLIEATVAAGSPQRSLRRHDDIVTVIRMDQDLANVLAFFQPYSSERSTAIGRLVESIAIANTSLRVVFAGTNPNRKAIRWVDSHATDRVRTVVVEDGSPGDSRIFSFPNAT